MKERLTKIQEVIESGPQGPGVANKMKGRIRFE